MTLLYGTDTLAERMKKDDFDNPTFVSPNQKYSAYDNPRHVFKDDENHKPSKKEDHEERSNHAMGGVAKKRLGYPHTEPLPHGDHHPHD